MLARGVAIWLLMAGLAMAQAPEGQPPYGYYWPGGKGPVPYEPQEGDVLLLTSKAPLQSTLYMLARSGHPVHSGVVIRRYDDRLALLEVGGEGDWRVTQKPLMPRLQQHMAEHEQSLIWIRRIKRPLLPHESLRLTHFGKAQQYKRFSTDARLAMFILPLRPSPAVTLDQEKWFCSELTVVALQYAWLLDESVPPGKITPHDLYYDTRVDLRGLWHLPADWNDRPVYPTDRPIAAPRPRH